MVTFEEEKIINNCECLDCAAVNNLMLFCLAGSVQVYHDVGHNYKPCIMEVCAIINTFCKLEYPCFEYMLEY